MAGFGYDNDLGIITHDGVQFATPLPDIIVGNAVALHTRRDCHVLDDGDGVALKAAIEAMTEGQWLFILPGLYNLGLGAASAIQVQTQVRISGSGPGTIIRNRPSGVQQIFSSAGSLTEVVLEDMQLLVTLPTGAGSGATSLVALDGLNNLVRNLKVLWDLGFTAVEAANLILRRSIDVQGTRVENCFVDRGPSLNTLLGGTELINIRGQQILNCRSEEADVGYLVDAAGLLSGCQALQSDVVGVRPGSDSTIIGGFLQPAASGDGVDASAAAGCLISGITMVGTGSGGNVGSTLGTRTRIIGVEMKGFDEGIVTTQPGASIIGNHLSGHGVRGIHVPVGDDFTKVVGNDIAAVGVNVGILADADRCTVQGNVIVGTTGTGVDLNGNDNTVNTNVIEMVGGTTIADTGTNNDTAHNREFTV
jgi:hypothetical protein